MRYAQIREIDIANGPGIRVSLYVQGCHRHCPFCFNEETWDFNGGEPFTRQQVEDIVKLINRPHIKGFTLLGGEPLEEENRHDVYLLMKELRERCPDKSLWIYSSFLYEDILTFEEPILEYIDVLVDGPFINSLKDMNVRFKGSTNQRIIDVPLSLKEGKVILFE